MFDMVDYHRRQRNIRRITVAAFVISILSFMVVGFSWTNDQNTQTVLEFLCLSSGLVFIAGLLGSFIAWYEKKVEQWREKILNKDG